MLLTSGFIKSAKSPWERDIFPSAPVEGDVPTPKALRAVPSAGTPRALGLTFWRKNPSFAFRLKRRVPSGIYRGNRGPNPPPGRRCLTAFSRPCRSRNRQVTPGMGGQLQGAGAGRYLQAQLPALLGRQPAVQLSCKARRAGVGRGGRSAPHPSPRIALPASLILHPSPSTAHSASLILHHPPAPALHRSPLIPHLHPSPSIAPPSSPTVRPSPPSLTFHRSLLIPHLHPSSFPIHRSFLTSISNPPPLSLRPSPSLSPVPLSPLFPVPSPSMASRRGRRRLMTSAARRRTAALPGLAARRRCRPREAGAL